MKRTEFTRCAPLIAAMLIAVLVQGCAANRQPSTTTDICRIFTERAHWYGSMQKSERKWGTPMHVQMAIIWRESAFRAHVRAPRKRILWVIPAGRASSSRGFTQAIDGTWNWYKESTGNTGADRSSFEDSADFVGWYVSMTRRINGVRKTDAYNNYLAYHEGHGNFKKRSFRNKPNVRKAAREVKNMADRYERQLRGCRSRLRTRRSWF